MPPAAASSSGADTGGPSAHNRQHNQGNQDRKYTPEQKAAVLRIRRCQPTQFYEILEVQTTCTDAEIKKAYRKQSLLTHPDKNGHEHADEAFKMVARAFSVLGDKEKRDKFDRFGTDPDSRFSSAQHQHQQNPFAGFGGGRAASGGMGGGGGGMRWEEDISPEEMFARFFGGGGGGGFNAGPFGGAFDAGPQFFFNFPGGAGVRVHQFGGARPRARPRNPGEPEPETSLFSTLVGLLPILLLFIFPIITSIFSGDSGPSLPGVSWDAPSPPYTVERTMPRSGAKYFLNPKDVVGLSKSQLHTMDNRAETFFVQSLTVQCDREEERQRQLHQEAQGWFKQDPEKAAIARAYSKPACDRLRGLGVRR
ncbi:hypothetical protein B0H66DRAFT_314974 [Apodospora peruviana]|uniref:J domain-containing protein n=1 Tax=Apodospora peruviana TaxID=516989 RepID=A0AAE0HX78_9PEZI|nr:hypothetical protein B0H66DRAFT_314974 [Apodospora peruviana]